MTVEYLRLNPASMEEDESGSLYRKMVDGNFTLYQAINEYVIELSLTKESLTANGKDSLNILARLYDYLNNPLTNNNDYIIKFCLDEASQEVVVKNGIASIPFRTAVAGRYTITAIGHDAMIKKVEVVAV